MRLPHSGRARRDPLAGKEQLGGTRGPLSLSLSLSLSVSLSLSLSRCVCVSLMLWLCLLFFLRVTFSLSQEGLNMESRAILRKHNSKVNYIRVRSLLQCFQRVSWQLEGACLAMALGGHLNSLCMILILALGARSCAVVVVTPGHGTLLAK